jgi:REP element-mobilizing transposase RayT
MKHLPLYTQESCKAAYQLRWSLALFPNQPLPPAAHWLKQLSEATERDDVRVLEHHTLANGTELFLVSTTPKVAPPAIVKSIKGRLQHTMRPLMHVAFRRNFRLTSVGESSLADVEQYVAKQLDHHALADPRTEEALRDFQLVFPSVDLSGPVNSAHGQYAIALHIVLVHAERWRTASTNYLSVTRDAVLAVAERKAHRLSRLALLPDHVHFTVGSDYESGPADIALSYMNNIAYKHEMSRLFMDSYYVGTIGAYNMEAVRRQVLADRIEMPTK